MSDSVKQIVHDAVIKLIQDTATEQNIAKSFQTHEAKIHFVPTKYRVLGGLLQSLNIKFGNFIERLIALIVEQDRNVESLPSSGRKIKCSMTSETDTIIDQYITRRQLPESPDQCDIPFAALLQDIVRIETQAGGKKQSITKDVDALFRTVTGQIVYLEIKYNDDHDTGKFVDINRKFIKTYAGLVNHLNLSDAAQLKPILYYFNPVKRWGAIYTPASHIYRGGQLFDEFFDISFADIDSYLRGLGDDDEVITIFDNLYQSIRYGKQNA
jgi:hypothetical protein